MLADIRSVVDAIHWPSHGCAAKARPGHCGGANRYAGPIYALCGPLTRAAARRITTRS